MENSSKKFYNMVSQKNEKPTRFQKAFADCSKFTGTVSTLFLAIGATAIAVGEIKKNLKK